MEDKDRTRLTRMAARIDAQNDGLLYRTNAYRLIAESLRETEGQSVQSRRARAVAHILDSVQINLFGCEPFIGSQLGMWEPAENLPSYEAQRAAAIEAVKKFLADNGDADVPDDRERWALMSRVHHDASLNYADYQRLLDETEAMFSGRLRRHQLGRILEAELRIPYNKDERGAVEAFSWTPANHVGLDYEIILQKGWKRIICEINEKRESACDGEAVAYYEAAEVAANAASRFFLRCSEKCAATAAEEGEAGRKAELILMSDILAKLSACPAESFREALQCVWLLHIASNIIGGSAMSFSRFDQYMLPYYERDIKMGVPREELKELLCCFWLKINEPKIRTVQSMTVGGVRPDGSCACNGLTRLCLEAAREMRRPYPNIAVRVGKSTPDWVYDEIVQTVLAGCGQPMILNDDVFVGNFVKLGYPDETARDYFNMGCVELMLQGRQALWGGASSVIYTKILSGVLSGPPPESFEELMDNYLRLIREAVKKSHASALRNKEGLVNFYDPFCSLMTRGCMERGRDMFHGGAECPAHWSVYAHGLGTLADSLSALKTCVFDKKIISWEKLAELLDKNFEGGEQIRAVIMRETPMYGNDADEADLIANRVFSELTRAIFKLNTKDQNEDKFVSTFFSYFSHVLTGEVTKATPDGRLLGEPLSDSMAPSQGRDEGGPTMMLNSALKIDPSYVTGGYALNLKIAPGLGKTPEGREALKTLITAYVEGLGPQLQINLVEAENLIEAQKYPEKHRDLIVRVGGYCEHFVNLDKNLQNEIIKRTTHG
ncbi:MAG: pyruvate formate lyase [Defluviitaleaceae bacterium]|nr:pyruvate formate lyase [Defluviitaleaceae bacterium]